MITLGEAKSILSLVALNYDRTVPQGTAELWCTMFADYTAEEVLVVVREHMADSRFFPTVAELRERLARRTFDGPTPEEAWGLVLRAVRNVGYMRTPTFEHQAVGLAVDDVGWRNICLAEEENIAVTRAHFYRAYTSRMKRALHEQQVGRLEASHAALLASPETAAKARELVAKLDDVMRPKRDKP